VERNRKMKNTKIIYVHGKGGDAGEAGRYKTLFPECEVLGFDYKSQTPWDAIEEFKMYFERQKSSCERLVLIANSIGAFFSLGSLSDKQVDKAFLISPVVNMEALIKNLMSWSGVTEEELRVRKEIPTAFGETLSWKYLCYVRENPIKWDVPTKILYGENDNLTSYGVLSAFARSSGAEITVMKGGEHWFHTEEQMRFLDEWILKNKF